MATPFKNRFVFFARNITNPGALDPLEAAVDGSGSPVEFNADFNSGFKHAIALTRYTIISDKVMDAHKFGKGNPLTNGIQFIFRQANGFELDTTFQIFRNGDWGQFFDITMFGRDRGMHITLDYRKTFGDVAVLEEGTTVGFFINDNLTNRITSMKAYHFGYKMVPQ